MAEEPIERFFCNSCKHETKHFVKAKMHSHWDNGEFWSQEDMLIIECCGCETRAFVKRRLFSEDREYFYDSRTGKEEILDRWDISIYPPLIARNEPDWLEDLPDELLQSIFREIYKALQADSFYLATMGSRTLIDRLITLTVGDQGNFYSGLKKLAEDGHISTSEREILKPIVEAGNAAAHRAWKGTEAHLKIILDTIESLVHRLLVTPARVKELEEAVPARSGRGKKGKADSQTPTAIPPTVSDKVAAAPQKLAELYQCLSEALMELGEDVTVSAKKHYIAFRRNRNLASVQLFNRKEEIKVYLNLDPELVVLAERFDENYMRDVSSIGHFGTGDLEVTLKKKADLEKVRDLIQMSYEQS